MKHIEKMNKISSDIAYLIELLRNKGIIFTKGLSDKEILDIEETFMFIFPPDLKLFLQIALPISNGFVNWHSTKDVKSRH